MDSQEPTKFHLLEINLISAQELKPVRKSVSKLMQTYVVAWIDPSRKLTSRIDSVGGENPTWNDKFVFVIDDKIHNKINSTLVIEIYRIRSKKIYSFGSFGKDKQIGTWRNATLIDKSKQQTRLTNHYNFADFAFNWEKFVV
ncbi:C2 calcium-dependent membrane targeting [Macleaya cordata]|uniref:C2 calcium-dependent membrane targeting n=1 Tax=Macleaya cordata TaxID=56857 RepID=A0A200Q8C7_MACCD|nr:C2 calcium-dependent membrane targeting [Macleaya cordata]